MTERLEGARDWALAWQRSRRVPGIALVVTGRTDTLLVEVNGLADRAGLRPARADQRWQIGSISKAFTSVALLQLQARGMLSVHDRVTEHLKWLSPQLHPDITLHHLMSHTAGLPAGSEWSTDSLLESALQGTVGRPQPPGGRYHYSNPGYELLGDVVEAVTGEPLERHLEQSVLQPMGMTDAVASVTADDRERDVRGHRPPRDDVVWAGQSEQVPDAFFPTCTADGAIAATPTDIAVYLRFLLNGGSEAVLDADDFAELTGRHAATDEGWYGYGLSTSVHDGGSTLGHGGGMVGMFADVLVDRAAGLGTALMINGFGDVTEANAYVLGMLCGRPVTEPAWPPPERISGEEPTAEHQPYVGLYRSYNPWLPTLQVSQSGSELWLTDPVEGGGPALYPDASGPATFRVEHPDSPDVAEFDVLVDGRYQRLELSGCVYARTRRG